MAEAWQVLARNYARFDTPLRPSGETLEALRTLIDKDDPLVAVLGATPLFSKLARRVWFIDASVDALQLVKDTDAQHRIHKHWTDASHELAQADVIVGDGAVNALSDVDAAERLLHTLSAVLKPGAALAMRVFLQHDLSTAAVRQQLQSAFAEKRFSEVRFLIYGLVAQQDGLTAIADIDRYIVDLHARTGITADLCTAYIADYFAWRGMSPAAAAAIHTTAYFPSRANFETLLAQAGLRARALSAGRFALAQYTPIYVAEG